MRKYLILVLVSAAAGIATGQTTEKWQQLSSGMIEQQVIELLGKPIDTKQSQRGKIAFYQHSETNKGYIKYKKITTLGEGKCIVTSWVQPDWAKMPKPKPKPPQAPPKPMRSNAQARIMIGSTTPKTVGTVKIGLWADPKRWQQLEKGMTHQQVVKLLGSPYKREQRADDYLYLYGLDYDSARGIVFFNKTKPYSDEPSSVCSWSAPVIKPKIQPEICLAQSKQWRKLIPRKTRTQEEILEIFGTPLKIKEVSSSNNHKYGPHEKRKFFYYQSSPDYGYIELHKDPVKTDGKWVAYPYSWRIPEYWRDPEQWKKLKQDMTEYEVDQILGETPIGIFDRYQRIRIYARDRISGYVKYRGVRANKKIIFYVDGWAEPDWAESKEYDKANLPRQQKMEQEKEKLRLEKLQKRKEQLERTEAQRILIKKWLLERANKRR
jgi:outer membrane protein assembly factor BamE (lipoprotein component of BamABCDE complex)